MGIWEELGLLNGIDDINLKNKISNYYEKLLKILVERNSEGKYGDSETVLFPIIKLIFCTEDSNGIMPEIENFNVKEFASDALEVYELLKVQYLHAFKKHLHDPEAELIAHISKMFQLKYSRHNKIVNNEEILNESEKDTKESVDNLNPFKDKKEEVEFSKILLN